MGKKSSSVDQDKSARTATPPSMGRNRNTTLPDTLGTQPEKRGASYDARGDAHYQPLMKRDDHKTRNGN
jgi:hypothetical protein